MNQLKLFKYCLIVFLLFEGTLVAQDTFTLPNILPASPEASELGKYGNIPVNLSSGMIKYYIPIYKIENGDFELHIGINYSYNGLRIDEIPGILGLGWSLDAGGILTRQVRGRPDEDNYGYIGGLMIGKNYVIKELNNQLTPEELYDLEYNSANNNWDTQPDKFMVSVGSVSVTFYFDENKNIVMKPYKPYKIELLNQNNLADGFKVTDDQGIVYFFDVKEYTTPLPSSPPQGGIAITSYVSSWKLSKIHFPNNKEINLFYSNYSYVQSTHQEGYDVIKQSIIASCNNTSGWPLELAGLHSTLSRSSLSTLVLDSIQFAGGKLEFVKTLQDVNSTIDTYLARLDNILLRDPNNIIINDFAFSYDDISKTRKLLKKVEENNANSVYEFEYNEAPDDNIPYYKQDFWGYANANNSGSLIDFNDFFEPRKPNFAESSKGALIKVTYPTRGTTEIIYEPNTYNNQGELLDDFYEYSGTCAELTEFKSVEVMTEADSFNGEVNDTKTFTVTEDTYMKLNLHITKNAWPGGEVYAGLRRLEDNPSEEISCMDTSLAYCNDCSNAEIYFDNTNTPESANYQEVDKTFVSSGQFKLIPGTYELYAKAIPQPVSCGTCGVLAASANIQFGNNLIESRETGGFRVSKTTDCPDDTGIGCISKEYIYEDENGLSYGQLYRARNLYKDSYSVVYHDGDDINGNPCGTTVYWDKYSSSSNLPLGGYISSHIIYSKVIERQSADGDFNGIKEITYSYFPTQKDSDPEVRSLEVDEKEYRNGKVLKERLSNSEGDEIREIINEYSFQADLGLNSRVWNYKSQLKNGALLESQSLYASEFSEFYGGYDVDQLIKTEEFDYLLGDTIKKVKNFSYSLPQGFLKIEETQNSNGNNITTSYYYPEDAGALNNLTTEAYIAINSLISNNRISELIQKESVVKNSLGNELSKSVVRTNYFTTYAGMTLPKEVQTIKGVNSNMTDLESRIIYYDYDDNGNPLEVSKVEGPHIYYIWGYNSQYPIAKLENFKGLDAVAIQTLINAAIAASDSDSDRTVDILNTNGTITYVGLEGSLRQALQAIRASSTASKAMVTTYTYDPLIGVTSITDSKGYTTYYEYDDFNRLKEVKDANGNIISHNEYHYKDQ